MYPTPVSTLLSTLDPSPKSAKRVAVHTLGCKLNFTETLTIAQQFVARGYELTDDTSAADILIVNTCSVTQNAERECRQIVRRALKRSPDMFVAVTGCYAQLRPEEIASIEGVDVVLGAKEKFKIFDHISSFEKRGTSLVLNDPIEEATDFYIASSDGASSRTRAFLKVQDGCDYNCSFCTIPEARGTSRSGEIDAILDQAASLCESGFREIVLSGVNVGDFGRNTGSSFYELLAAVEQDDRITARIRISSIEPNLLKDEIIDLVVRSNKFCHHFHIPLQSGSPAILKLMQRRYNRELYRSRIERIKATMPNACIGADVIVGFPGETETEFEETYEFIRELDLSYLHVFTYSERPGTKAVSLNGIVPSHVRSERNERLRILSEKKLHRFYHSQLGSTGKVILEQKDVVLPSGQIVRTGHTSNYVNVRLSEPVAADVKVLRVRLTGIDGDHVVGEPIETLHREVSSMFQLPVLAS